MSAWIRSRVGLAIIGAIIIGGAAAAIGVSTVWHPASPLVGAVGQNGGATATAESTATPEPAATQTPQPTATIAPTVAIPTPTSIGVGSALRGRVVGAPDASSFKMTRNGVTYTIWVDGSTTYTGTATQLSGLQNDYRVTVTIKAVYGSNSFLASRVSSSIDN